MPDTEALECIVVERYYVSGADDSQDGLLPEGSVTYRVFLDMKPTYEAQIMFGTNNHPLDIKTTTNFYNHPFGESMGIGVNAALFPTPVATTIALDSYLTIGAATSDHTGVLKASDPDDTSILGQGDYLTNFSELADEPAVSMADGYVAGTVAGTGSIGIPQPMLDIFGTETIGNEFEINDGSWYLLDGLTGMDDDNLVFVGQFTTDGTFTFNMNVQMLIPEDLQCFETPTCNKVGIMFVHTTHPNDEAFNNDIEQDRVIYQTDCMSFDSSTIPDGVEENALAEKAFDLFPNPTSDNFNVVFNEDLTSVNYILYDVEGRVLQQGIAGNAYTGRQLTIQTSNLNAGTYLLQIVSEQGVGVKRIIKQ